MSVENQLSAFYQYRVIKNFEMCSKSFKTNLLEYSKIIFSTIYHWCILCILRFYVQSIMIFLLKFEMERAICVRFKRSKRDFKIKPFYYFLSYSPKIDNNEDTKEKNKKKLYLQSLFSC